MGSKSRTVAETETCLSEAFLFATICIIGLPVDVHVRDGSVYSGTFYTASIDKDLGIVLKESKLTKKGKCETNVASGNIIETLVILSGDFVQVVAKEVQFLHNVVDRNVTSEFGDLSKGNVPSGIVESEERGCNKTSRDRKKVNNRIPAKHKISMTNGSMPIKAVKGHQGGKDLPNDTGNAVQVEHGKSDGSDICKVGEYLVTERLERTDHDDILIDRHSLNFEIQREKSDDKVQSSSSTCSSISETKVVEEGQRMMKALANGVSGGQNPAKLDDQCSGMSVSPSISTFPRPMVDVDSDSNSGSLASSADMISPKTSESAKHSKEFKLNPEAKIFYPSYVNPVLATPAVPAAAGVAYVPSNSHMVPFASYPNFAAVNGANGPQISRPIVGHMGTTQPPRFASQSHGMHTAPAYVPPNPQAVPVVVGRFGQLFYVQPVPHSNANASPLSALPPLASQQVQYPKHQGGHPLQVCPLPPPPFVGQQPPLAPIPYPQCPIPPNLAIPVPGPNSPSGAKSP